MTNNAVTNISEDGGSLRESLQILFLDGLNTYLKIPKPLNVPPARCIGFRATSGSLIKSIVAG